MLPGPKVGLIIGKSGKTIKQLQEQSGAKMVVIQDGPNTEYVSCYCFVMINSVTFFLVKRLKEYLLIEAK